MRFAADRAAIVTGAGTGIGRVIAARFAEAGVRLVVADLDAAVTGDILPVTAAFAVFRFRNGRGVHYVGRYKYQLTAVAGRLLIKHKRVELDLTALRPAFDVAIIL